MIACAKSGTTRGTTPTHSFATDIDLSNATSLYITYWQRGKVLVEKTIDDVSFDYMRVLVRLSQEDTLLFNDRYEVSIQIRAKFGDGSAIASNVIRIPVCEILKEGEI